MQSTVWFVNTWKLVHTFEVNALIFAYYNWYSRRKNARYLSSKGDLMALTASVVTTANCVGSVTLKIDGIWEGEMPIRTLCSLSQLLQMLLLLKTTFWRAEECVVRWTNGFPLVSSRKQNCARSSSQCTTTEENPQS